MTGAMNEGTTMTKSGDGGGVISYGNDGVLRPLTFDLMAQLEQDMYVELGGGMDIMLCSRAIAQTYRDLFEFRIDGGCRPMFWRGGAVVVVSGMPDGHLMMMNVSHVVGASGIASSLCAVLRDIEVAA